MFRIGSFRRSLRLEVSEARLSSLQSLQQGETSTGLGQGLRTQISLDAWSSSDRDNLMFRIGSFSRSLRLEVSEAGLSSLQSLRQDAAYLQRPSGRM